MSRYHRVDDAGYVTVFALGICMAFIAMLGLLLDGGRARRAHSDGYGVASAAARAGAQELDATAAVAGAVRLDPDRAALAAQEYLDAQGLTGTVSVGDTEVTVTVTRSVEYQILPGSAEINATATSRATRERATP